MGNNDLLQETFNLLDKRYGINRIKRADELPRTKDSIVSTGIIGLDTALGVGGIKKGSIIEVYAPEGAGKTTLALQICRQYQKQGKPVLYIDTERTLTKETIESMGIETENFYLMHVCNLEMALEVCKTVALNGAFSAVVIDSLAGLAPKAEIDGDVGDYHVGLISRIMSQTLPVLTAYLADSGCTLIVITQIPEKVDVMFGNPERTTGGRALKYYATVRLDMRRIESIKNSGEVVGSRTRIKVVKNKIAPPFKETEFDIMFGKGISIEGDILDNAAEKGIITKYGTWFSYNGNRIAQGRENAKQYLKEHPVELGEITEKLREICFSA
jgi:protein RecA